MSILTLEARAEKLFNNYDVTPEVRDRYKRDWIQCVKALGDKWLFAQYAVKLTTEQQGARCEDGTYRVTPRTTDDSPRA
jgi:hypothetical protein